MSLNKFNKDSASDDLLDLLDRSDFLSSNREENINSAHELLRLEEEFNRKKERLTEPSVFKQLFVNDFSSFGEYLYYCYNRNARKFNYLQSSLFNFISEKNTSEASLLSRIKQAQTKIAYLNNFNNNYSWQLITNFSSISDFQTQEENQLQVNTNAEEATLPIENVEEVFIKEVIIHDESNCIVGKPSGGNNKAFNLLEDDEYKIFSAYKVNDPNMSLNLNIRLQKEEVVNHLFISLSNSSLVFLESIEDILFYDLTGTYKSIKQLSKNDLSFNLDKNLEAYFLPVKAKNIILKLKQTKPYYLNEAAHYQIDLNVVKFNKVSFKEEGVLKSTLRNFGNYLSVKRNINIFPETNGYTLDNIINLDRSVQKMIESDDEVLLLNNYSSSLSYDINLKRNLSNENIIIEDSEFFDFDLLIRPFNPSLIYSEEINENFYKDKIKVAQILKGTIKGSNQNEVVDIGFDSETFGDRDILLITSESGTEGVMDVIPADGKIQNPNKNKIKIEHCFITAVPILSYDYYYIEMGEFFELNSVKFMKSRDEGVELDYSIYLDNNKIKGVAIKKEDLSFQSHQEKLSNVQGNNSSSKFFTNKSIVKGSLRFLDNLGEGLVEKEFIDGIEEFKALSDVKEEYLNSQNVSSSSLIVMELEEEASSAGTAAIYKDGVFISNVVFNAGVDPATLAVDEPTIDPETNIFYLNTSEPVFFSGYSIKYQFIDQIASAERCFSVDYYYGGIHFSFDLDSVELEKRVSFLINDFSYIKFDLAKYFDVSIENDIVSVFDEKAVKTLNLNLLRFYLGKTKQSINLKDNEKYFSPIISSFKLSAV